MASSANVFVLRLPKKLVFATIVVAVILAGLEIGQRISDARKWRKRARDPYSISGITASGQPFERRAGPLHLRNDPDLIYTFEPGQRLPGITINAQGFRGADWSLERPPGRRRIIVVGGSTAFGHQLERDQDLFTVELARLLAGDGVDAEVCSAGVVGYDSRQELILLATRLRAYRPDVLVILDGWNDFYGSGNLPPGVGRILHPRFTRIDALLAQNRRPLLQFLYGSAMVRGLERRIQKLGRRGGGREFGEFADNTALAVPRYRANLEAMCRLARADGTEIVVAPQPELFQRRGTIPAAEQEMRARREDSGYGEFARQCYPRFVAAAAEVAAAEGVAFCDTTTAFDALEEPVFCDFVHLTARGNELLAAFLHEPLRAALD